MRLLLALALVLLFGSAGAHAKEAPSEAALKTAWEDLEQLEDLLDDPTATNAGITTYMDAVIRAAGELRLPDAGELTDPTPAQRRARADWLRSFDRFRDETVDLLLEGLTETSLGPAGRNVRAPVNKHAGALLAQTPEFVVDARDRRRLARRIIRKVKRLERVRHAVHQDIFEAAFMALANLGEPRSLKWIMENYLHALKQPEQVARLRAALRSMRQFKTIPPRLRHELVDEMLKRYLAMESLAEQSSTDISALAAKRFWDEIRTDAIPLIQYAAGYPRGEAGTALATMHEFSLWFREHDDVRDGVWDPEQAKARE